MLASELVPACVAELDDPRIDSVRSGEHVREACDLATAAEGRSEPLASPSRSAPVTLAPADWPAFRALAHRMSDAMLDHRQALRDPPAAERRAGAGSGVRGRGGPPLNVVCFRVRPAGLAEAELDALHEEVLLRVQESGFAVPSSARTRGRFALRCAFANHRTRPEEVDGLVVPTHGRCRVGLKHGSSPCRPRLRPSAIERRRARAAPRGTVRVAVRSAHHVTPLSRWPVLEWARRPRASRFACTSRAAWQACWLWRVPRRVK
jgi:hypothetical protein